MTTHALRLIRGSPAARRAGFWLLLALLATFAVHAVSLQGFYLADDFWHLREAARTDWLQILDPEHYRATDDRAYWFMASRGAEGGHLFYFRPVIRAFEKLALELWGASPVGFQIVSLAPHLASTAIVAWLAWRLIGHPLLAVLIAALFGLHPGHYEAVAFPASGAAQSTVFAVLTVAAFVEARRSVRFRSLFWVVSLFAFLFALGSKESTIAVPALLAGSELVLSRGMSLHAALRAQWRWHLPFWGIAGAYLLWRLPIALGIFTNYGDGNYIVHLQDPMLLPELALNCAYAFFQLFLLYPLVPIDFTRHLGIHSWWAAGLMLFLIVGLWLGLRRLVRSAVGLFDLGMIWIMVTLAPFAFAQPTARFLHLAVVGFALIVGALAHEGVSRHLTKPFRWRSRLGLAGASLMVVFAILSASYGSALSATERGVQLLVHNLDRRLEGLAPTTEVYLIDYWQLAYQADHFVELTRPALAGRIFVLNLDPSLMPPAPSRLAASLLGAAELWRSDREGESRSIVAWPAPCTLRIAREGAGYFNNIISRQLGVVQQARRIGSRVNAGPFLAFASAETAGRTTELTFEWPAEKADTPRVFLQWTGTLWQQLRPPAGWDRCRGDGDNTGGSQWQ
jgi:hypothetical protein